MIDQCANPNCGKPLHYLREGKVFVFDLPDPEAPPSSGRPVRRVQHFWLCGVCAETMRVVQSSETEIQVQLTPGRVSLAKAIAS